jgi:hypothetical protein
MLTRTFDISARASARFRLVATGNTPAGVRVTVVADFTPADLTPVEDARLEDCARRFMAEAAGAPVAIDWRGPC